MISAFKGIVKFIDCTSRSRIHSFREKKTRDSTIIMQAAQTIWNYMQLGHELHKSDVILVLGNNDLRTAEYAADLFNKGLADWLLFSGKEGSLTKGKWKSTEAEIFRDVAINRGVPDEKIILETRATNTGENIRYSYNKLHSLGINPTRIILVQTPYMERRSYATFKKQWVNSKSVLVQVTSAKIGLTEFPNDDVGSINDVITVMIGCLQRIISYPKKGFQIYQDVPEEVEKAYQYLRDSGLYNNHLLRKS
ncbi:uncharacterized protein SCO4629 [Patella vulgata]|uniref:uncharacterized protein SCO4629 n=1 Tax=Patella vulgata TaxID=6465 RepID=UPI00217FEC16|nr:uncharacterized protein SCO4629 [Patella vulgata]